MVKDILSQLRENSLEVGALGSRSHDDKWYSVNDLTERTKTFPT
jgi:hypothetical protein